MSGVLAMPFAASCRGCSYDLAGLVAPGVCPECGLGFVEHTGEERITLAWPCLKCGYPLLGLRRSDRCSECGTPAARSLNATHFRFQPAAYRARVRRGALLAAFGMVGLIVLPFVGGLFAALFGLMGAGEWIVGASWLAGSLSGYVLYTVGWWMLLAAPPASLGLTRGRRRLRRGAQTSLAVAVLTTVALVGTSTTLAMFGPGALGYQIGIAAQFVVIGAYAVFFFSGLLYLRPLLERASSARRRPGAAAIVTLCLGALAAVCMVAGFAIVWSSETVGFALFIAAACAGLITYIASVVTLESMRSSLTRVGREIAIAHRRSSRPGETPPAPLPNTAAP